MLSDTVWLKLKDNSFLPPAPSRAKMKAHRETMMNPKQLQQLDHHLNQWRTNHADTESVRAAYRQQVLKFTLSSMALENESVSPERLAKLLDQPARRYTRSGGVKSARPV